MYHASRSIVRILLLLPERERMHEPIEYWLRLPVELLDAPGLPAASTSELKIERLDVPVLSEQLLTFI